MAIRRLTVSGGGPYSLAAKLRRRRFILFESLIASLPRPLRILDVGGTMEFWENMNFCQEPGVHIVLLNIFEIQVTYPNFSSVLGDAKNMKQFEDQEFDVVFSNSVIDLVGGGFEGAQRMANEVKRVGKRFFIQTPNRHFPLDPITLLPFFQYFPLCLKLWIVTHFETGFIRKIPDRESAIEKISAHRMLTREELRKLFPGANIWGEKFLGLSKSFIVYGGWDVTEPTDLAVE